MAPTTARRRSKQSNGFFAIMCETEGGKNEKHVSLTIGSWEVVRIKENFNRKIGF